MKYEYGFIVKSFALTQQQTEALPAEISKFITTVLGEILLEVSHNMDLVRGGGWEILSHQLIQIGHSYHATFLMRHPKP